MLTLNLWYDNFWPFKFIAFIAYKYMQYAQEQGDNIDQ